MLVLSRKKGERIHIGQGIVLTVLGWQGSKVRLGIEAPEDVVILREEIQNHWRDETMGGLSRPLRVVRLPKSARLRKSLVPRKHGTPANENKERLGPVH
jgi:carbon storage regulator